MDYKWIITNEKVKQLPDVGTRWIEINPGDIFFDEGIDWSEISDKTFWFANGVTGPGQILDIGKGKEIQRTIYVKEADGFFYKAKIVDNTPLPTTYPKGEDKIFKTDDGKEYFNTSIQDDMKGKYWYVISYETVAGNKGTFQVSANNVYEAMNKCDARVEYDTNSPVRIIINIFREEIENE